MSTTYGLDSVTGEMSVCRARPENRGRGNCNHAEHVESDMTASEVDHYNEVQLAAHFAKAELSKTVSKATASSIPKPSAGMFKPHPTSKPMNRPQFNSAVVGLADAFPEDAWKVVNKLYGTLHQQLRNPHVRKATNEVYSYLTSSDPDAQRIRDYLGPAINLRDFSSVLVSSPKSMRMPTAVDPDTPNTYRRALLTKVDNDMSKKRYVASVLYFGGRCCYCNQPMDKTPRSPKQATGEHLTPISPKAGEPTGSTRFGNMALACLACNAERRNTKLEEWVRSTKRIPEQDKQASLDRIARFREFALYDEYTPEQTKFVNEKIDKLREFNKTHANKETLRMTDEDKEQFKALFHDTVNDLREKLRS